MVHSWLVLTILGKTAATIGPLPGEMPQCFAIMRAENDSLTVAFKTKNLDHDPHMVVNGQHLHRSDMNYFCVVSKTRPPLEYK
jgi:hypothetical protein